LGFQVVAEPLWLGPKTTEDLKALSKREAVPLFATLLAAFQTLLYRETGREDISVGVFLSSGEKATEGFAGLPMVPCAGRAEFADDPPFRDLLRRTRIEWSTSAPPMPAAAAPANTDQAGDLSRLVSVSFGFGGGFPSEWPAERYDLAISLFEEEGGLRGVLHYDSEVLQASVVECLPGHFLTLLKGLAAQPDQPVSGLPLLTPEERHRILIEWNDTRADLFRAPLPRLFEAQVARTPDRIAVEFQGRRLTYRELDARANALALRLEELGVGPEVLVGVFVERSAEMLVALLAVLKAGGAYVPMDPGYPKERLAHILEDSAAAVVITEKSLTGALPAAAAHRIFLEEATAEAPLPPPQRVSSDSLAYVIYTSGSTGRPKGVLVTHGSLTNLLLSMRVRPGMDSDDVLLAVTTLSFDIAGLELYLPLVVGGRLVVAGRETTSDGDSLANELERCRATVMQATPATWRMLLESGWQGRPGLKVLCGGEAMSPQLARRLSEVSGSVWNLYGPTETTIWSSCERVEGTANELVSIGRPIANTRLYVLDGKMEPVPVGVLGELCIGGSGVARGYRNLPELTAQKFQSDPFEPGGRLYRTGDLARSLPDGRIVLSGRLDDQVKIRGFRIELGEIETVLARHPAIRECVAVARPDESGEKRLVAYVVARDQMPTAAELRAFVKEALPEYMAPALFVPLSRLPLTPNGKLDRRALPEPGTERPELEKPFVVPRDVLELELARIWRELFQLDSVGVRDDFFELGGHSLSAGRLFAKIQKSFGKNLPPTALLGAPTIAQLAVLLRGEQEIPRWSSLVPIQTGGSRPPLFCMHAGGGTVLYYHDLARELGPDQPVYGLQARGLYGGMPPHAEVEEMAAHYIREIRTVQPQGPYSLAGFCFGGVLAFAMAQQLRREGAEVALLASFDGGSPRFDYALRTGSDSGGDATEKTGNARSWLTHHRRRLGDLALREKIWYLAKRGRNRFHIWRSWLRAVVHLGIGDLFRLLGRPLPESVRHTYFRASGVRASMRYAPAPYPGRMFLFERTGAFRDRHMGWDGLVTGGLEIHEIPVRVASLEDYHRFFIPALAGPLKQVLRAVETGRNEAVLSRTPG
jgi:amino acid adenylation domain-containing protein